MIVEIELPAHVKRAWAPKISAYDPRRDGFTQNISYENPTAPPRMSPDEPRHDPVQVALIWSLRSDASGARWFVVSPQAPADLAAVDKLEAELRKFAL